MTNRPGSVVFGPPEDDVTHVTIRFTADKHTMQSLFKDKVHLEFVWVEQDNPSEVQITEVHGTNHLTYSDVEAKKSV